MLIGNYSVTQKTPLRYIAGSTVSVEGQVRSNFDKSGMNRNRFIPQSGSISALSGSGATYFRSEPNGYYPPYTDILPTSAGGIGSINEINGSGVVSVGNLNAVISMTSNLSGTGSFIGNGILMANVLNQVVDNSYNFQQAIQLILAATAGKVSGAAGTTITFRNPDDTKNRIVATVDSNGNRTAITYDTLD